MSLEVDCFKIKRWRWEDDRLIKSDRVLPGASEQLQHLQKVEILATCDVDNSSGTVRLKTSIIRSRKLSVELFSSHSDKKDQKVLYNGPIKITGDQELVIIHKPEKKEVVISLHKEEGSQQRTSPVDVDHLVPVA